MAMNGHYDISTDEILCRHNEVFSITGIGASNQPWWNRTLSEVSGSWIRLGVLEGDFHWHKHDDTDEFFFVLEGNLDIELPDKTLKLGPGDGATIARGTMHFPHAHGRVVVLMVEKAGVLPTGS